MLNNRIAATLVTVTLAVIMAFCGRATYEEREYTYSKIFFSVGAFLALMSIVEVIVL